MTHACIESTNPTVRMWGPTIAGLGVVPALPFMFDHPVERVLDVAWEVSVYMSIHIYVYIYVMLYNIRPDQRAS